MKFETTLITVTAIVCLGFLMLAAFAFVMLFAPQWAMPPPVSGQLYGSIDASSLPAVCRPDPRSAVIVLTDSLCSEILRGTR
jgi:hypothetical protein